MRIYAHVEQSDSEHLNDLVAGPWNHGGWMGKGGRKLGPHRLGEATSRADYRDAHFRAVVRPLAARQPLNRAGGHHFRNRERTVAELRHVAADAGRDRDGSTFAPDGKALVRCAPGATTPSMTIFRIPQIRCRTGSVRWSDLSRSRRGRRGSSQDQRFVDHRPDVLSWQTDR